MEGIFSRASGIWKYPYKSGFMVTSPQEMNPHTPKDVDETVHVVYYNFLPYRGFQGLLKSKDSRCSCFMFGALCPLKERRPGRR